MDPNGKWLILVDDEDFDRTRNRAVEIARRSPFEKGDSLLVDLSPSERIVITQASSDGASLSGSIYRDSKPLPPGNPKALWTALERAGNYDDPAWDELPICDPVRLFRDELVDAMFAEDAD